MMDSRTNRALRDETLWTVRLEMFEPTLTAVAKFAPSVLVWIV